MEQIKRQKLKNPNIFVSTTRLCIRNLPITVDDKKLKQEFLKAAGDKSAVITEVIHFDAVVKRNLLNNVSAALFLKNVSIYKAFKMLFETILILQ